MHPKTGIRLAAVVASLLVIWSSATDAHERHLERGRVEADAVSDGSPTPDPRIDEKHSSPDPSTSIAAPSATDPQPVDPPITEQVFSWVGRLHPMMVHFPIALLLSAAIAELLFAATGQELYRNALRFSLWGGTGVSILSVVVLAFGERADRAGSSRLALRLLLGLQAAVIGGVGFLGGSLLYEIDHLSWGS